MNMWSVSQQDSRNTDSKRWVLLLRVYLIISWEMHCQYFPSVFGWAAVQGGALLYSQGTSWLLCNCTANPTLIDHWYLWKSFNLHCIWYGNCPRINTEAPLCVRRHRIHLHGLNRALHPNILLKAHRNFPSSRGCRNNLLSPCHLPAGKLLYIHTSDPPPALPAYFDFYKAVVSRW